MNNTIIDIIRSLNTGSVIPFQEDEMTKARLRSGNVELYVDFSGKKKKYYYFSEFMIDDTKKDNLEQIESEVLNDEAYEEIGQPQPSDSYMILLWKVEKIDEKIYPHIIDIEENEFFYKKYVFYYTDIELNCFKEWYKEFQQNDTASLTEVLNAIKDLDEESEQVKFLTRLLIKVPFLNPVFPRAVMSDFDKMVQQKITKMRQGKKELIKTVNDIFMEAVNNDDSDMEMLSNEIYQKLMEE